MRQAAYTTSPLAVSCRQSSRPMPELQPVITTWAIVRVSCGSVVSKPVRLRFASGREPKRPVV